jgi:hypothetical protein
MSNLVKFQKFKTSLIFRLILERTIKEIQLKGALIIFNIIVFIISNSLS